MAQTYDIFSIAHKMGLEENELIPYGYEIAKVKLSALSRLEQSPRGKLILVTAMTPTPAGEGKTTTAIGLADALNLQNKKTSLALRQPSLALAFGLKGPGVGGGRSTLVPPREISLLFTGDFYAVEAAHNLLAAAVDEHAYSGNTPVLSNTFWQRTTGVNDRTLREVMVGLGSFRNGTARIDKFQPAACSELMGILCLSKSYDDLAGKLSSIVIGSSGRNSVKTEDIGFSGPLAAVLAGALLPNLVRTQDGSPAFIHCGPYANTSLGFNSIIATEMALRLSDFVVTEAGGASDTGGEKFFNIKSRLAGLEPCAAVVVATVKALRRQGGAENDTGNLSVLEYGTRNLLKHLEIIRSFGVAPVVAINRFPGDRTEEINAILRICREFSVPTAVSNAFAEGGQGAFNLAETVLNVISEKVKAPVLTYSDDLPLSEKIRHVSRRVYDIPDLAITPTAKEKLSLYEKWGFGKLPVCMAKSHTVSPEKAEQVTDVSLAAGAGYITAYLGDIVMLPALPRGFNTSKVRLTENGTITGLF